MRCPPGLGPAGHYEPQSAPATGTAEVKKDQQGRQFCAATSAKGVPKEKPQYTKKKFCKPLAFCFNSVSCLGLPGYIYGVTAVRNLATMSLDHFVKRCFFLLFPKNRAELKFLLPLDACSLNPVRCASESACNFLLLSRLQEAKHTADRDF